MSGGPVKNLAWLRAGLQQKLNFNPAQTDQDFQGPSSNLNALLDGYLNEAYILETNLAKIEFGFQPFTLRHTLTWAASSQTLTVPRILLDHQIYKIEDETDAVPGKLLWIGTDGGRSQTIAWRDRDTLQWGSAGPGSARTLTVFYSAAANPLVEASHEPDLIPPQYRHLLIWSAAILGRYESDEEAPMGWIAQREEWRRQYWTLLSRGVVVFPLGYTIMEPGLTADSF